MQNLTTTLLADIREKRQIALPAGSAAFNWVDVDNVAEACALLLQKFDAYSNQAITLTGSEQLNFGEVAKLFRELLDLPVEYLTLNPISYFFRLRRQGVKAGKILVMILLHFSPRFQARPALSDWYRRLCGKEPTTLKKFLQREADVFR
jgi:uncharacterized protein YbjT (DUF2867 family)